MEDSSRLKCKFRFGQVEFEIEGEGKVDDRIVDRIVSLLGLIEQSVSTMAASEGSKLMVIEEEAPAVEGEEPSGQELKKKKDGRGGRRIRIIPAKIQDLGIKGKIKSTTAQQVALMIKEDYGIPVNEDAVYAAMCRQLQKTLIRTGTTMKDSLFTFIEGKEEQASSGP
jgi:hypothetical protein